MNFTALLLSEWLVIAVSSWRSQSRPGDLDIVHFFSRPNRVAARLLFIDGF
jgi:hypothetical protein